MDWSKVWDEAKAHPYAVGGAILVLVLILWWAMSGSGSTAGGTLQVATPTEDPNVIAANTSLTENQQNNSAQVAMAGLQLQDDQAQLNAATTINQQNVGAQTAQVTSTNNTALSIAGLVYNSANTIAGLQAHALETQYNDAANVVNNQTAAALALGTTTIAAQLQLGQTQLADELNLGQLQSNNSLAATVNTNNTALVVSHQQTTAANFAQASQNWSMLMRG